MDSSSSRRSDKIRDIVHLQQLIKKWKNLAHNNNNKTSTTIARSTSSSTGNKSIKFLKKTLSFSDILPSSSVQPARVLPKGYMAVSVGKELKRFVIPPEYLSHQAFGILLREVEDEFGFQQEGVLQFPCEVELFEKILKIVEYNKKSSSSSLMQDQSGVIHDDFVVSCGINGY